MAASGSKPLTVKTRSSAAQRAVAVPEEAEADKPLRKDVARNRNLLLQAADELFAVRGTEATLEEIARHAGVGVATAYRHFETRQALVEAMFETRLNRFLSVMQECEDTIADPREAFETMLYRICELQARDAGTREALATNYGLDKVAGFRERGRPKFSRMFERAKKAGTYRPDCDLADFICVFWMIARVGEATHDESPHQWRRQLDFLLDGLRAHELPRRKATRPPLTKEQVETIMSAITL
jgi:AcrR family transcriptional regulator